MAYTLSFTEKNGCFHVAAQGEVASFEVFLEKAGTVLKKITISGAKRILLDDRLLAVSLDAHDITLLAAQLEKADVQSMGLRLASLCREEDRDVYDTIETIYRNRSINLRVFSTKGKALEWLLG